MSRLAFYGLSSLFFLSLSLNFSQSCNPLRNQQFLFGTESQLAERSTLTAEVGGVGGVKVLLKKCSKCECLNTESQFNIFFYLR